MPRRAAKRDGGGGPRAGQDQHDQRQKQQGGGQMTPPSGPAGTAARHQGQEAEGVFLSPADNENIRCNQWWHREKKPQRGHKQECHGVTLTSEPGERKALSEAATLT